jgi:hypothetical protein
LIHQKITSGRYHKKRTKCNFEDISEWDPQGTGIRSLIDVDAFEGEMPDAG